MHARIQAQGKELEQRDLLPQLWGAVNTVLRRQGADALELVWGGFVAKREVLAWLAAKMDATDNKPLLAWLARRLASTERPALVEQLVQFARTALRLAATALTRHMRTV